MYYRCTLEQWSNSVILLAPREQTLVFFLNGLIAIAHFFTNQNQEVTVLNDLSSNNSFEHENIVVSHLLYDMGKMQETIYISGRYYILFFSFSLHCCVKPKIMIYIYIYLLLQLSFYL